MVPSQRQWRPPKMKRKTPDRIQRKARFNTWLSLTDNLP